MDEAEQTYYLIGTNVVPSDDRNWAIVLVGELSFIIWRSVVLFGYVPSVSILFCVRITRLYVYGSCGPLAVCSQF